MKLFFSQVGAHLMPTFSFTGDVKHINLGTVNWTNQNISVDLLIDKYNKRLLLSGKSFIDKHPNLKFKITFDKRHMSILKSQIQKCARRSKVDIGVKTAISMILIEDKNETIKQTGLFELLRRLTIIIIEDTVLSEKYSFLVWCMAVLTKGHYLNGYCVEKILEITKGMLASAYRDPSSYQNDVELDIPTTIKRAINNPMVMSVLFRSCYKGMNGDYSMVLACADKWLERYDKHSVCLRYTKLICALPIEKYEQLRKDELQPESLDHHCTNIAERIKKYIEMDDQKIKSLIWTNESAINDRIDIKTHKISETPNTNAWTKIKFIHRMETKNLIYEL
jgi:hypothetical protein